MATAAVRAAWVGVRRSTAVAAARGAFGALALARGWCAVARRAPRWDVRRPRRSPPAARLLAAEASVPGTVPAVAGRACWAGGTPPRWPTRLPWRRLLLGVVRRRAGVAAVARPRRRLRRARRGSLGNHVRVPAHRPRGRRRARACCETYVDRIPYAAADNWPTHVAGHPPGALLFFVGLVRLGLGGDLAAGARGHRASRRHGARRGAGRRCGRSAPRTLARRAAPFLVLDARRGLHGGLGRRRLRGGRRLGAGRPGAGRDGRARRAMVGWAVLAGLLLGCGVLMSYGLPLLGLLALAVLLAGPLVAAAAGRPGSPRWRWCWSSRRCGFAWWEAYPVLRERYWDGHRAGPARRRTGCGATSPRCVISAGPLLRRRAGALAASAGAAPSTATGCRCCSSRRPRSRGRGRRRCRG